MEACYSEAERRRFHALDPWRAMISALVAVAIVLAPLAAAWAGGARETGVAMSHPAPLAGEGDDTAAAAPMEDCASMMKGASTADDCACCDEGKACPPQLCMAKCIQFFGLAQQSRAVAGLMVSLVWWTTSAHPPGWSDQPHPPPPRT